MAFHRAQRGRQIDWVGYTITVSPSTVEANIKEGSMFDLRTLFTTHLANNWMAQYELRSLVGKANHVATLIYAGRPLLDQLWAAISENTSTQSASCKVWAKQIWSYLTWLLTFLQDEPGMLVRRWRYDYYSCPGLLVSFHLDASPFGLGGALLGSGIVVAWFSCALSWEDLETHGHEGVTVRASRRGRP